MRRFAVILSKRAHCPCIVDKSAKRALFGEAVRSCARPHSRGRSNVVHAPRGLSECIVDLQADPGGHRFKTMSSLGLRGH